MNKIKLTVLFIFITYFFFITVSFAGKTDNNSFRDVLKGQLQLVPGIEEYNLLVKFRASLSPDINTRGNIIFVNRSPITAVTEMVDKYGLTFVRAVKYSKNDLENLRTSKRNVPDKKGFNIYDFAGLLYVQSIDKTKEQLLKIGRELESLQEVEYCCLEPVKHAPPPEDYPPTTPDLVSNQDYRGENPGIDIDYAWSLGLKGKGLLICDLEWSWGDLDPASKEIHEDLIDQDIKHGLPKKTDQYEDHGTAVMGLLLAVENEYGINGSVPEARGLVFPEHHGRAAALLAAIDSCKRGDIILLEMQTSGADGKLGPADNNQSVWDATKAGSDAGVIIVGTAGNGGANLDASAYDSYRARGDNGVIMSGAGSSNTNHDKLSYSTYGNDHVHIQGWGENVFTLGYGDHAEYGNDPHQEYTKRFSGTSSSGPISTSAVALIQSYAKEFLDTVFTSLEIRELLVSTGIPQGSGGHIGPLPNLRAAIEKLDSLYTGIEEKRIKAQANFTTLYGVKDGIKYVVPKVNGSVTSHVRIDLYNLKGTLVKTLVNETKTTNEYHIIRFTNVAQRQICPAGVYLCKMQTKGLTNGFKVVIK